MDTKRGQQNVSPEVIYPADFTSFYDVIQRFSDAMRQDLGVFVSPIADGEIHRIDDPTGKPGNLACWYVIYLDSRPTCVYGNWRTGEKFTDSLNLTFSKRVAGQNRNLPFLDSVQEERQRARASAQEAARKRARKLWEGGKPATVHHPYIARKRIPALNAREMGGWLLIPIFDGAGELVNIQRIDGDGQKRFLKGGRIGGCFSLVGAPSLPKTGRLYIVEGWATAATLHAQTRHPVVAALNAGNLKLVAMALLDRYDDLDLVLAADNDHRTPGNPGITKAAEAAEAVGGGLLWPRRCAHDCKCTDFNDVANCGRPWE